MKQKRYFLISLIFFLSFLFPILLPDVLSALSPFDQKIVNEIEFSLNQLKNTPKLREDDFSKLLENIVGEHRLGAEAFSGLYKKITKIAEESLFQQSNRRSLMRDPGMSATTSSQIHNQVRTNLLRAFRDRLEKKQQELEMLKKVVSEKGDLEEEKNIKKVINRTRATLDDIEGALRLLDRKVAKNRSWWAFLRSPKVILTTGTALASTIILYLSWKYLKKRKEKEKPDITDLEPEVKKPEKPIDPTKEKLAKAAELKKKQLAKDKALKKKQLDAAIKAAREYVSESLNDDKYKNIKKEIEDVLNEVKLTVADVDKALRIAMSEKEKLDEQKRPDLPQPTQKKIEKFSRFIDFNKYFINDMESFKHSESIDRLEKSKMDLNIESLKNFVKDQNSEQKILMEAFSIINSTAHKDDKEYLLVLLELEMSNKKKKEEDMYIRGRLTIKQNLYDIYHINKLKKKIKEIIDKEQNKELLDTEETKTLEELILPEKKVVYDNLNDALIHFMAKKQKIEEKEKQKRQEKKKDSERKAIAEKYKQFFLDLKSEYERLKKDEKEKIKYKLIGETVHNKLKEIINEIEKNVGQFQPDDEITKMLKNSGLLVAIGSDRTAKDIVMAARMAGAF